MSVEFSFRSMQEEDLPLMLEWLNRPHLQAWWSEGEKSLDGVRDKYLPRIYQADAAIPFIAFLDGEVFAYIQYYYVAEGPGNWWPDAPGKNVIGIDQFIADESQTNKGYGTQMIRQFISMLREQMTITEIRVDPRPSNARAIRCYEKVGFQQTGLIQTPDGPAMMMRLMLQ